MPLNHQRVRQYLKAGDLASLFVEELGWNYFSRSHPVVVGGDTYTCTGIAENRGVQVFACSPAPSGGIPERPVRAKIDTQLRKLAQEHLIVFVDATAAPNRQVWQWVDNEPGRPRAIREHEYHSSQTGDALIQKFGIIRFELDGEEEELTLLEVRRRAVEAFGRRDKVTKKFYDRFKAEHGAFLGFIEGIPVQDHREWYASVMLNRLMFVYFIEKKGFLDGDIQYLRHRLAMVKQRRGEGQFFGFYKSFLRRLFHEGLGASAHSAELEALIGKVPYLNGGIFDVHQLERDNPDVDIADEAFERLFDFFDDYDWHLDDRPLHNDNEINPDVLGYIFEKYINQKQMGAYYTKEDITEYISKNTVLPFLLDVTKNECRVAFEPDGSVWRLLRDDPDRYIYDAVRKGVDEPLPPEIEAGISDVSKRGGWNRAAPAPFALPTETWREHVARRTRCLELRRKLAAGEVTAVNDLITLNLNIRQFTQDVIQRSEGRDVVRAFYLAMSKVSVLDPTCGSGAFLFAALNILQTLYDACLDRMEAWIADEDRLGRPPGKEHLFRKTLAQVAAHPNREYFVLKSIIIDNLFGVDIMEEAVEICKLRLFLKLVAQVEDVGRLEPLPDIDFNIRAGNTLVGFSSLAAVREAMSVDARGNKRLLFAEDEAELRDIEESAEIADRAYQQFREQQTRFGGAVTDDDKRGLRERLQALDARLDRHLARQYGTDPANATAFKAWQTSHQPFHWFVEFYGVMNRGGFNAIIGNPPYLERHKLDPFYEPLGFRTRTAKDIYAWVIERSVQLSDSNARVGLIVPVSVASAESFNDLRDILCEGRANLWVSHFSNRPSQLFEGGQNRLTVVLRAPGSLDGGQVRSTRYHRWDGRGGERETLFPLLEYHLLGAESRRFRGLIPKVGSATASRVLVRLMAQGDTISQLRGKAGEHPIYWVRVPGYFCQFFLHEPQARPEGGGNTRPRGELNHLSTSSAPAQAAAHAALNGSLYFQFFSAFSDGRHINPSDVLQFPLGFSSMPDRVRNALANQSGRLAIQMGRNTKLRRKAGLLIESADSTTSKPIIDEIDRVLAQHYGFTAEELDFIINYDIKYRMGADSAEDE